MPAYILHKQLKVWTMKIWFDKQNPKTAKIPDNSIFEFAVAAHR